jgi:hypothetical protein
LLFENSRLQLAASFPVIAPLLLVRRPTSDPVFGRLAVVQKVHPPFPVTELLPSWLPFQLQPGLIGAINAVEIITRMS